MSPSPLLCPRCGWEPSDEQDDVDYCLACLSNGEVSALWERCTPPPCPPTETFLLGVTPPPEGSP